MLKTIGKEKQNMKIKSTIIILAFICFFVSLATIWFTLDAFIVSTDSELSNTLYICIGALIILALLFIGILVKQVLSESAKIEEKFFYDETLLIAKYLNKRILEIDGIMKGQAKNGINYRVNKARIAEIESLLMIHPNLRESLERL